VKEVDYLGEANRYASENLCKVGMLKRITYPTGGYTDFEFEINRFNDEYFYPDAASLNRPDVTKVVNVTVSGAYGSQSQSKTFSLQKETKCTCRVNQSTTASTNDVSTVIIKNASTGSIIKTYSVSNGNTYGGSCDITLAKGDYIIEASVTANRNSYSTVASCDVIYTCSSMPSFSLNETKGGASIGGGLRVKSIKNYDYSSKYLNGIEYEYRGGKLLTPTVRMEKHFINFSYLVDEGDGPPYSEHSANFSYAYASSEPSYLYVCSLGVPGTVGYSMVIKKEVDENGQVVRRRELEYHNYSYENNEPIYRQMQNFFYTCTNGYLNGKLEKETLYSATGEVQYKAEYVYNDVLLTSVLYPKCVPAFFPVHLLWRFQFNVEVFKKNVKWCYLARKNETFYDISGSKTTSRTTSLTYDSSNYQPSEQTVSDGTNSQKVKYWYPFTSGNQSKGLDSLKNKNYLSEVTGIDQYRNNKFIGGSRYDYTSNNNLPVVSKCYSILPNDSTVLQMTVTKHDGYGNIREYKLKDDSTSVTIIWSYNHQLPVMEIVGSTYADVKAKTATITSIENADSVSVGEIRSLHSSLSTGLSAHVTAYQYNRWHSVSRIIAPNGYETTYNYDNEGRLIEARDPQGILQKYQYNYKIK
jgi:YD repeat-containing protein